MEAKAITDARKEPQGPTEAIGLLEDVSTVYIGRGKKFAKHASKDLKESEEARKGMFGPTGNLRAPTLRLGRTLVVGFCAPMYDEVLGG